MSLEHFRDPLREFVPAQFRPINFFAERWDGLACREPTGAIRPFAAHDRATPVVELLQSFPLWLRGFNLRRVHHYFLLVIFIANVFDSWVPACAAIGALVTLLR